MCLILPPSLQSTNPSFLHPRGYITHHAGARLLQSLMQHCLWAGIILVHLSLTLTDKILKYMMGN